MRSHLATRLGFWIIRQFGLLGSWAETRQPGMLVLADPRPALKRNEPPSQAPHEGDTLTVEKQRAKAWLHRFDDN